MLTYREMAKGELDACASLSAESLYDYEYFSTYFVDERRRKRFLDAVLRCEFKANRGNPGAHFLTARDSGTIVAVAILCSPDFVRPSDLTYLKSGWIGAMIKGGVNQAQDWDAMDKKASAPCHALTGKNWYLSSLAVSTKHQGKGVGSKFLHEYLIPYAKDAGGETFSLFTNSETNCRFYEKNGFTLFDKQQFVYEGRTMGSWSYKMALK